MRNVFHRFIFSTNKPQQIALIPSIPNSWRQNGWTRMNLTWFPSYSVRSENSSSFRLVQEQLLLFLRPCAFSSSVGRKSWAQLPVAAVVLSFRRWGFLKEKSMNVSLFQNLSTPCPHHTACGWVEFWKRARSCSIEASKTTWGIGK